MFVFEILSFYRTSDELSGRTHGHLVSMHEGSLPDLTFAELH